MSAEADVSGALPAGAAAARLRGARASLSLTQQHLSEVVGVSEATIRSWEKGGVVPKRHHRPPLVAALHLDAEQMDALWDLPPDNIVRLHPDTPDEPRPAATVRETAPELWDAIVKGIADGWASYAWWNRTVAAAARDAGVPWPIDAGPDGE